MNRQIWKYTLRDLTPGKSVISMPKGAEILSVHIQELSGEPRLWAQADPENDLVEHAIYIAWTGRDFNIKGLKRFLGTLQYRGLVWHIFDIGE